MTVSRAGFTLLELSIVLVIIGLLAGGVVVGRDIVRNAELNSVIANVRSYNSAVNAFHDQYNALPGDFAKAATFWTACVDSGGYPCNGDGDGQIEVMTGGGVDEELRAWQHLSLAGLIQGGYTGLPLNPGGGSGAQQYKAGTNIPASRVSGGGYRMAYTTAYGKSANAIDFASPKSALWSEVISPVDAYTIDAKIDDGKPDSGMVYTINGTFQSGLFVPVAETTCVSSTSEFVGPATYLSNTTRVCTMIFWLG